MYSDSSYAGIILFSVIPGHVQIKRLSENQEMNFEAEIEKARKLVRMQ